MSWFGSVENFFKKIFGNTNWVTTAKTTITLVTPLAQTLVTELAGPEAGAEASTIAHEVLADLGAVNVVLNQVQAGGSTSALGTLKNLLGGINGNMNDLLSAGHIKNDHTKTVATTIIGEINAILQVIPSA